MQKPFVYTCVILVTLNKFRKLTTTNYNSNTKKTFVAVFCGIVIWGILVLLVLYVWYIWYYWFVLDPVS